MAAAWAIGPNTARPASRRRSARPATSGASGPTTVRSIRSRRANATRPSSASAVSGTHTAWRAMPGLPGAVNSAVTRGLWAIFQASACSRPPPPTISILIGAAPARPRHSVGGLRQVRPGWVPSRRSSFHRPARPRHSVGGLRQVRPGCVPSRRSSFHRPARPRTLVGRLDELEVGARDPRPGAARVELEVALPVSDRLRAALDPHQRAGEVKVGVGVVGRDLKRPAVVGDRLLGEAAVLVEASEVVGGLTAARVVRERRAVRGLPLVVATEPVERSPRLFQAAAYFGSIVTTRWYA